MELPSGHRLEIGEDRLAAGSRHGEVLALVRGVAEVDPQGIGLVAEPGRYLNNRAENSHLPMRRRERAMLRFRRMRDGMVVDWWQAEAGLHLQNGWANIAAAAHNRQQRCRATCWPSGCSPRLVGPYACAHTSRYRRSCRRPYRLTRELAWCILVIPKWCYQFGMTNIDFEIMMPKPLPELPNMTSRTVEAITDIFRLVQDRNIQEGERLPSERSLAEKFHMGRGAVREALSVLELIRLIERRPNSGIYLRDSSRGTSIESLVLKESLGISLNLAEIEQALDVRRLLEVRAIQLACVNRSTEDLTKLGDIFRRTVESYEAGNSLCDLDRELHMEIAVSSKNIVLTHMLGALYELSARRRALYFSDQNNAKGTVADHALLIEKIRLGDVEDAAKTMRNHIGQAEAYWLPKREEQGGN